VQRDHLADRHGISPLLRHCEERSDAAIQKIETKAGWLRSARNGESY
jgi:hypothetical protein